MNYYESNKYLDYKLKKTKLNVFYMFIKHKFIIILKERSEIVFIISFLMMKMNKIMI